MPGASDTTKAQDEENPRDPETDPITEEELARRISLTGAVDASPEFEEQPAAKSISAASTGAIPFFAKLPTFFSRFFISTVFALFLSHNTFERIFVPFQE